jgi:hypothetical protein
MPLMHDWATSLYEALESSDTGSARVIGLEPNLRGDVFETRLGEFLTFQASLPLITKLSRLGSQSAGQDHAYFGDWLQHAKARTDRMVETIRAHLFESFGYPRFNDGLAQEAYSSLRSWVGEPDGAEFLAFATTNYDACIESAFGAMGFTVMGGFHGAPYATPVLDPLGLAANARQSNGLLPVLHLHGAVGWYRGIDGKIRHASDLPYNPTLGVPALLLPDPTKSVDSLAGAERIWDEFRLLLSDATHILVLGHSLNDAHLVEVLNSVDKPLAVSWHQEGEDHLDEGVLEAGSSYVRKLLPTATVVPCDFGPHATVNRSQLNAWLSLKS